MTIHTKFGVFCSIISIFSEAFFLEDGDPMTFQGPWSKKLHMDLGSGHSPNERGGPKESNGAYFSYYH